MIIDPDLREAYEEFEKLHVSLERVQYDVTALGGDAAPTVKSLCATTEALFAYIADGPVA